MTDAFCAYLKKIGYYTDTAGWRQAARDLTKQEHRTVPTIERTCLKCGKVTLVTKKVSDYCPRCARQLSQARRDRRNGIRREPES